MFLTRLPEPVSTTYIPYRGVCIRTKSIKRYPVNRSRKGTEGMRQKEKKKTRKAREKHCTVTSVMVAKWSRECLLNEW